MQQLIDALELVALSMAKTTQPNLAKGEEPLYSCAECNEPVFVVSSKVYKPCGHKEAAVLANLKAIVRGESGVK